MKGVYPMAEIDNSSEHQEATKELDIQLESINSVALARLIEEVQNNGIGELTPSTAYNRTYHRHNR